MVEEYASVLLDTPFDLNRAESLIREHEAAQAPIITQAELRACFGDRFVFYEPHNRLVNLGPPIVGLPKGQRAKYETLQYILGPATYPMP